MKHRIHSTIQSLVSAIACLAATGAAQASTLEMHSFTNLYRNVPDGNFSGLSDTRSVTSSVAALTGLRVKLQVAGQFNGDLYAYVRQVQEGRTNLCVLLNRVGRASTNGAGYADTGFHVTFNDTASNGDVHFYRNVARPTSGTPLTGVWQPDGRKVDPLAVTEAGPRTTTLSEFNGGAGSGEWTLFVADVESGATNQLVGWELELEGRVPAPLSWAAPASITYGTALSGAQLNATSTVAGTYIYDPPAGTILNAGNGQILSVTFVPADTNYLSSATNVVIDVAPATLTITANDATKVYGAALPAFTASYSGFVNGDTASDLTALATVTTPALATSPAGTYTITASGAASSNYAISYVAGTLTIGKASTAGALASSRNPSLPGELVTFSFNASAVAPGAGTPDGMVVFRIDGVVAGSNSLSGGVAQFGTTDLTLGSHTVAAEYAGSANFLGCAATLPASQLVNTPPVAGADTIQRWATNGTKVSIASLLTNDYDADGDPVSFVGFSGTSANGGTVVESSGWLFYSRPPGFTNSDSFTYTISDGRGAPVTGTVWVMVREDTAVPPNLTVTDLGGGSYLVRGNGIPGLTYRVQYTENMSPPTWTTLGPATANAVGAFEFTDSPGLGHPARFYRSVYP